MTEKIDPIQPAKDDQPIQIEGDDHDHDPDHEAFALKNPQPAVVGFTGDHAELYTEALERYGQDGSIDPAAEKKLKRKIDRRILPLLGICYFFYCEWIQEECPAPVEKPLTGRCRQDDPLLRCDFWHPNRLEPERCTVLLALFNLLLWMAHLGYSLEFDNAAFPSSILSRIQYLHVSQIHTESYFFNHRLADRLGGEHC
jgi:hypothetical protein